MDIFLSLYRFFLFYLRQLRYDISWGWQIKGFDFHGNQLIWEAWTKLYV